jgi:hypothetical protein
VRQTTTSSRSPDSTADSTALQAYIEHGLKYSHYISPPLKAKAKFPYKLNNLSERKQNYYRVTHTDTESSTLPTLVTANQTFILNKFQQIDDIISNFEINVNAIRPAQSRVGGAHAVTDALLWYPEQEHFRLPPLTVAKTSVGETQTEHLGRL